MTLLQWAALAALRQEPRYRFVGAERQLARRLQARGWLHLRKNGSATLSARGAQAFAAFAP